MVALFVLLTFIILIVIGVFIERSKRKENEFASASLQVFDKNFFIPSDVSLSKGHLWLKQIKDGLIKLGVDEFVVKAMGKINLIPFKIEDEKVSKGDILFQGSVGNNSVFFHSPINGVVKHVNKNLSSKNVDDPYGDDWGLILIPEKPDEVKDSLSYKKSAVKWLKEEFERFKEFLSSQSVNAALVGVTRADGGNITAGVLSNFNEETWKEFEKEFLIES